jgi:DNA-binding beta-propeller fold protein YncE
MLLVFIQEQSMENKFGRVNIFSKAIFAAALVVSLSACVLEGDDGEVGEVGAQGPAGAAGTPGANGADGQNGNAGKDLEPEYIAVSSDSKTAFVAMQENNAMCIVDLEAMTIEIRALGFGRLKTTTALGDANGDGEFEAIYAYGARSFSIWDQNINLVFDSGDDFGKISSAILGEDFNSAHTENKGDNRSDDKGGEPEAIDVGEINGRIYAFNAGDLGPESIKFISASNSPNGNALIVIGNEVSGTVTVYQITEA